MRTRSIDLPAVDWLQIITLALIQGITEFLPISSTAHLILPSQLTDWPDQGLAFDVALHLGTLTAVCWYFKNDLGQYVTSGFAYVRGRAHNDALDEMLKLACATLPVILCGFLFRDWIALHLRNIEVIAATTVGFAVLLALADRRRGELTTISWQHALIIGVAQALALVPGTSRSGITLTAALWLGLSRTAAARFAFLLAIPAIAGAALLTTLDLTTDPAAVNWQQLAVATGLAALSAYLCIAAFVRLVERTGMLPYVIYRLLLGVLLGVIAVA